MSSSNSTSVTAIYWNLKLITLIWGYSLVPLGIVGHTLNIYVFTRRRFRSNPCGRYFLASTIGGFLAVFLNIPVRLLQSGYNIDLTTYSIASCKIVIYLTMSIKALCPWFIACACVDRYFSSSRSVALRKWSNLRTTRHVIPIVVVIIFFAYSHSPFFYTLDAQRTSCTAQPSFYRQFNTLCSLFVFSLIPSLAMLIFGLLTVRNYRQAKVRIAPDNTQARSGNQNKKTDRQMIRMMIVQTFVYCATTTPFAAVSLYIAVTANWMKDALQKANDDFVSNITRYISLIAPALSFYIFTLTSQSFRRELMHRFHRGRQTKVKKDISLNNMARPQ